MDRTTSMLIGGSALALVVVCSGLAGVIVFGAARRADVEQAELRRASEEVARQAAQQAAEAARQQELIERARAEAERAAALAAQGTQPEGPASSAGDRSTMAQQAVRGATSGARRCYQRALARQPGLSVRAELAITYGLDGSASEVRADLGELADGPVRTALEECLERVYSEPRIPPGAETLTLTVPLVFQAG